MKILGIGNAIVDVICKVEDSFLSKSNLAKSTMKLVDETEFKKLLSKQLIEKHNGKVPKNFDGLHALPGVGRKTANVVLNEGFGFPTIAVDTHIFRVSNRTGLALGKNPDQVEQALYKVVPKKYLKKSHHYLLLHGRYTCKARVPSCKTCVIIKYCKYKHKEL